ncbi:MAG: cation:proton antiporter [Rhodocyclaceae bacterium]|jgi:NhaP-type Na+/H+ or K+/H+ antiporter|nr:cation:proton antiporter [Rhodocyclaceae bacterium]
MDFLPVWPLEFNTQIAFGLLLFAGVIGGYFAHRISWMPSITGFMAVGVLIGPSGIDLLTKEALEMTRPLIDVALALILYRLGLSLDLRAMLRDRRLLLTGLLESAATFIATFAVLSWLGLPGLIAGLAAAIVISSSPAVLIHVAHEVGAAGPVTERTKELVALNNLFSFFVFSALLPAGHLAMAADWGKALLQPVYQVVGSMVIAALIALVLVHVARLTRDAPQYRLALIIGALLLGVGIAYALNLSALFVPLAIGVAVRTLERDDLVSDVAFGEAFELLFVVLFVYAGAKIHLGELPEVAGMALILVAARGAAKWITVFGLSRWQGIAPRPATATGLLLMPMAGLAIGLAQTADTLFALQAAQLNVLILATVAILETLGPPIAAWSFRFAGEAGSNAKVGAGGTAEEKP